MLFDINKFSYCFKTEANEAFLWHGETNGIGGPYNALIKAEELGGKTLERCMVDHKKEFEAAGVEFTYPKRKNGIVELHIEYKNGTKEEQEQFWIDCMKSFVSQASGEIRVFEGTDIRKVDISDDMGRQSVAEIEESDFPSYFNVYEYGEVKNNQKVPHLAFLSPEDGQQTRPPEVFNRAQTQGGAPEQKAKNTTKSTSLPWSTASPILKEVNADMKYIDVGKLKVSPFVFDNILELQIDKRLNEHNKLHIRGIVSNSQQITPVTSAASGVAITCENDGQVYFKGVLQNVKITCVDDVYRLDAYAISNTALLDTLKHKRSFQDNAQTYQSIVDSVIADIGASATYNAPAMTVENIILQYNETDWAFAKRLASHTQDVLIPITSDKPEFHFGATDNGGAALDTSNYTISRDFDVYRHMSTEDKALSEDDATVYSVETDEYLCGLGEKFSLNGIDLRVRAISISYKNSALSITYTLSGKKAISTPKKYNSAITGLLLDGTVTEVVNDTLKLKLDDDQERGVELDTAEAHLFKYATGYSMETHTGWYVMPEEGDTVQLLFPIEDEKFAYATSAVRREDTERTGDYLVKYLRTSFGKEIKFDKNEILVSALDDVTYIRINEDTSEGIEIITPHPILIQSGSTLDITSEDDMTITTEKNLYIEAKESIKIVNAGNTMDFVPDDGIAIATDKKLNVTSDDNATLDSKKEVGVKSGKDMTLESGAKLVESAESKMELSCSGSSIMLQSSGIDIKGTLIKEN